MIKGTGSIKTESRTVEAFHAIELAGSVECDVEIGPAKLEVIGDDNIVDSVITEVNGGTLHVGMKDGSYSTSQKLVVHVVTPTLDAISSTGAGGAIVKGIDATNFSATNSGSAGVLLFGKATNLSLLLTGSASLNASDLQVETATVKVTGSGRAYVEVSKTLDVTLTGSGNLKYYGHPKITEKITGSGVIESGN